jgi:hypothetical protein
MASAWIFFAAHDRDSLRGCELNDPVYARLKPWLIFQYFIIDQFGDIAFPRRNFPVEVAFTIRNPAAQIESFENVLDFRVLSGFLDISAVELGIKSAVWNAAYVHEDIDAFLLQYRPKEVYP